MAKVNAFDVNSAIEGISEYAPIVVFLMMVIMFALTGWMQHHFLVGVLEGIPGTNYLVFLFPLVIQVLRFVTGFLSASFFKKKKWGLGIFVFCFSVWLSVFEYGEVEGMASFWTQVDIGVKPITHSDLKVSITKEIITGIMVVLIWGALVLEFFLASWIGMGNTVDNDVDVFSSNGASKDKRPSEGRKK